MKNSGKNSLITQPKSSAPALKATHQGVVKIGPFEIDCEILPRDRRLLTNRSILRAIVRGAKHGNLNRYIDRIPSNFKGLIGGAEVEFIPKHGGRMAKGRTPADFINLLRAYQQALNAGQLREDQVHIGLAASDLLCALAGVGLDAMIDEACGYHPQETRHNAFERWFRELRNLDVKRILGEGLIVAVCRLHGWVYEPGQRPPLALIGFVGKFYQCILGEAAHARFKAVCDAAKSPEECRNRMYQFLEENPLNFARDKLIVAEAYAKTSRLPQDFWNSMYTYVWGQAFQLPIGGF